MDIEIEKTEKPFKQLTISKSSLFEYMLCPWSWNKRRNLKQEPSNQTDISGLIRGSVAHKIDEFMSGDDYKQTKDLSDIIKDVFMEKINDELARQTIKVGNLYDLCKEYGKDNVIFEKNGERKYRLTHEMYTKAEISHKDKIDEMYPTIPKHIENIQIGMRNILSNNVRVEIREENYIHVKEMVIKTISIFDKVFDMSFESLTVFNPDEITLADAIDYYSDFTVAQLKSAALLQELVIEKGLLKEQIVDFMAEKNLEGLREVLTEQKQGERDMLKIILESNGYKPCDKVPVILDTKTKSQKKSAGTIKNTIDPYVYCAFYFLIYGKIPVFMYLNSVVTKTLQYNQTFYIGITFELLKDWYSFLEEKLCCMYDYKFFNKNLIDNWKCSPDYCQYFEECQKNKITVFER